MTSLIGGILLPSRIFASGWFQGFATFVAFNTLFYVLLSILKIIPIPRRRSTIPASTSSIDPMLVPRSPTAKSAPERPER